MPACASLPHRFMTLAEAMMHTALASKRPASAWMMAAAAATMLLLTTVSAGSDASTEPEAPFSYWDLRFSFSAYSDPVCTLQPLGQLAPVQYAIVMTHAACGWFGQDCARVLGCHRARCAPSAAAARTSPEHAMPCPACRRQTAPRILPRASGTRCSACQRALLEVTLPSACTGTLGDRRAAAGCH